MLKNFDSDDLVKLWSLVHERFNSTEPTEDKERELWVELKRLFEPDDNDILWKLQRYMHDPLKWRLYDTCVVYHVSTERGHDIFMLVEKDYPLTRALMTLMLSNKLQVDEYSVMGDELLRKIFILANRPRQERVASVAINARQRKGKLHDIFSDTSFISTDEFQEDKPIAAFWVLNNQFSKFIDWQYFLDYDSKMTEKLFAEYTRIKVKQFRETLLLHMGNVKKSVAETTRHKKQYNRRMKERQMQSRKSKVVSSKALDASLVVTEYIRPVNDQVPSVEVHLIAQHNVLANEQQHTDQSEPSYDTYLLEKVDSNTTPDSINMSHRGGVIDQDAEQDQVKSPLLKVEFLKMNDMVEKEVYNELSNRFLQLEKHCGNPPVKIFTTLSKEWIPTRKVIRLLHDTKVDSEGPPKNGSNDDITNPYECDQTLNISAGTLNLSVGPGPQLMTPGTINSRLVQNIPSRTPIVPPTKNDWDSFFQPMFDEYFKPPPNVDHPVPEVHTPVPAALTSSPSSTTVDQDVPSTSTSLINQEIQSQVTHQGVEEQIHRHQNAQFDNTTTHPS
ncbi:hypothetical protein Tco_0856648 [Tanacetum coccineum]|uniref:Uncharacterized protein n=1 Tax=Tanacetum coccineum TaxID=301880 RepID=A0ABQ5B3X3_9ASTR